RHPHRHRRPRAGRRGLVRRPRPVSGGPQGPAHPPARDEGLGLGLAPPALGVGSGRAGSGEPLLAGSVPELQGGLPLPPGKLRQGGGRGRTLRRSRLPHLHSRRPRERRRDGPHGRRVRARRRAGGMSGLLQQAVTAQAQARPEAAALVFKDERLSYGALEAASNRLARLLKEAGCSRGDRVGLLMPKSASAIVAILGVLKADAIYVPMDPASPAARQARVLEVSDCSCMLTAGLAGESIRGAIAAASLARAPLIGWLDEGSPADVDAAFTLRDLD